MECANCENKSVNIMDYLIECVNFPVSQNAVRGILLQRGAIEDVLLQEVDTKTIDLCRADLYVWICTSPSRLGSVSDSDNDWSHTDGGFTLSDRDKRNFMALANSIYEQYGEEKLGKRKISIRDNGVKRANKSFDGAHLPIIQK